MRKSDAPLACRALAAVVIIAEIELSVISALILTSKR
jgi:hypothetical protein